MAYTKSQWSLIITAFSSIMCVAMISSLQAPFYPAEAEKKGVTPTEYGFVFSSYELAVFTGSLIYGKFNHVIGGKYAFIAGTLLAGSTCIMFGFSYLINDRDWFLAYCFVFRILEGFGQAMARVSIRVVLTSEFKDSVGSVISWLQTFTGIGLMLGLSVGGVLYDAGGFMLPFVTVGSLAILGGLIAIWFVPRSTSGDSKASDSSKNAAGYEILKIPGVWIGISSAMVGMISMGYLAATLEPHLRVFQLSGKQISLFFIISALTYAVTNPLWGKFCDLGYNPRWSALFGALLMAISYALIGPLPFIPIQQPQIWYIALARGIFGVALGGLLLAGLLDVMRVCKENGYTEASSSGISSSVVQCSFSLGSFIGPSLGGILLENMGFREGTLVVIGLHMLLVVVTLVALLLNRNAEEKQRLIADDVK